MRRGVGMTGVSGGGMTTMFAALLDGRITAAGPACCAAPNACHPVLDVYAPCAETLAWKRFADGYDDADLLGAAMPTPVLLMAGARDEVFKGDWSNQVAADVLEGFRKASLSDRFRYFSDPGGHGYSIEMARQFVQWMDRWVRNTPERQVPAFTREDFELADPKLLQCGPRLDVNMFTVNRDLATALCGKRSGLAVRDAARQLCNVTDASAVPTARQGEKTLVWFHWLEELMLQPAPDIELPATFLYPARDGWKGGAVLYFDDRGRWTDLRGQGPLTAATHFVEKDTDGPAILSVDLRGWGDTAPADLPYDLAGWADRSRWTAYVSAAGGDPILSMRIRDGLAALAWLRSRGEIDPAKVIVGGRGMGGIVALHVAAIDGQVAGVFSTGGLATFESLAASESYAWSPEDFLPGVLLHYDLPELVNALSMPVLIANPLDAAKEPLNAEVAATLYPPRDRLTVATGGAAAADKEQMLGFVAGVMQK
jgi:predicted esterase